MKVNCNEICCAISSYCYNRWLRNVNIDLHISIMPIVLPMRECKRTFLGLLS